MNTKRHITTETSKIANDGRGLRVVEPYIADRRALSPFASRTHRYTISVPVTRDDIMLVAVDVTATGTTLDGDRAAALHAAVVAAHAAR